MIVIHVMTLCYFSSAFKLKVLKCHIKHSIQPTAKYRSSAWILLLDNGMFNLEKWEYFKGNIYDFSGG